MLKILATNVSLLVDGISLGVVLFLISAGLSITLGVMRVVNLAHCGFAMLGGYAALVLTRYAGVDLVVATLGAAAITGVIGALLEHTLYRWVYATGQLGQIMMTIGLAFVMVSSVNFVFGSSTEVLPVPEWLKGNWEHGAFTISVYRSFLIAVSIVVLSGLWALLEYTTFGAQLRAAVDNAQMARCIGINVPRVFAVTFAIGCVLAAMGGSLGSPLLPLDPWYALKFLVLALMVVSVGGMGSLKGSFFAALLLGVLDTLGRYYVPAAGAFVIYLSALAILVWRPYGLYGRA